MTGGDTEGGTWWGAESGGQVEAFKKKTKTTKNIVRGVPKARWCSDKWAGLPGQLFLMRKMETVILTLPVLKGY